MVVVVRSYWPQSLYCQMDKTGDCGRTQVDRNLHRSRSQRCHVQYRRNRKSQQSECVPVSLHSTTLYAGLQK